MLHSDFRVLLLDADGLLAEKVLQRLSDQHTKVLIANSSIELEAICLKAKPKVIILDTLLADDGLFSFVQKITSAKIISIGLPPSGHSSIGIYAHIEKPVNLSKLSETVRRAFHDLEIEEGMYLRNSEKYDCEDDLIGERIKKEIVHLVHLASSVSSPVLITGETGTGKNIVAKFIHLNSPFHDKPFVGINCATLPESLMEAELFGHEKGAFTNAVSSTKGIFEMADGGTLFLDEIGEIPLHLQSKLLNVLEEKTVRKLGSSVVKHLDFRIIASTSISLENALGHSFRQDLYYRINVLRIHLPPLRQRPEDIPELCKYFLKRIGFDSEKVIPDSELKILTEYEWPGNIRELKNVLERAVTFQSGPLLYPAAILKSNGAKFAGWDGKAERRRNDRRKNGYFASNSSKTMSLIDLERKHIQTALQQMRGNLTKTAKELGISLSTLKRKIKEYGLHRGIYVFMSHALLTDFMIL